MLAVAKSYVPSLAVAEEVVQDAWLGVLRGISRFECRSSFRTWLFRILVNRAISAGSASAEACPWPTLSRSSTRPGSTGQRLTGAARAVGRPGRRRVVAAKMSARILAALDGLPPRQREVVTLRDVQGLSSAEVCAVLEISPANQRVLLHRGRSWLRKVIESEFGRAR